MAGMCVRAYSSATHRKGAVRHARVTLPRPNVATASAKAAGNIEATATSSAITPAAAAGFKPPCTRMTV